MPELVTLVELDSGVSLYVGMVGFDLFQAIQKKGNELYPDIDPKPYEVPADNVQFLVPIPGTKHEDYIALQEKQAGKRQEWLSQQVIKIASLHELNDRAGLVKKYAERVATLRQFVDLPDDAWEATLFGCVIASDDDHRLIWQAALKRLPITGDEIQNSFRIVRLVIQQAAIVGHNRKKTAQSASETEPTEPE